MSYLWLLCVIKIMIKCLMWIYTYIFCIYVVPEKKEEKNTLQTRSKVSSWILFSFDTDTQTHKYTYSQCSLEHSAPPPGLLELAESCVPSISLLQPNNKFKCSRLGPVSQFAIELNCHNLMWRENCLEKFVHLLESNKPRTRSKSKACIFRQVWVVERLDGLSRVSVLAK